MTSLFVCLFDCLFVCKTATLLIIIRSFKRIRVVRRNTMTVKFPARIELHSRNGHWTPGTDHTRTCNVFYDCVVYKFVCLCVLFCFIKVILGNRCGPGVSSKASKGARTHD